ncbi:hypothetical protein GCM10010483_36430 [Actinokineospora diospyrosa]
MRVGISVDGYNLYYGGREACGRSTPGWRWLDVRATSGCPCTRLSGGYLLVSSGYTAGALSQRQTSGAGHHWWRSLNTSDYTGQQLPDPAGGYTKPLGW